MADEDRVLASTTHLLALVRKALDEFDDRPLAMSVRRAVRIASLLGESHVAVRLSLELRTHGGDQHANGEDLRRLLVDRSTWGDPSGPARTGLEEYLADRSIGSDKVRSVSIAEMEFWENYIAGEKIPSADGVELRMQEMQMLDRIRHRTFTALCEWERRLTFGGTNEAIFAGFQRRVNQLLSEGSPLLVNQFNAVHRRMTEAAVAQPGGESAEELAQAVTSCRRILKAVIDHVLPGEHGLLSEGGHVLDKEKYRNRMREFAKRAGASDNVRDAIAASLGGLSDRFDAMDNLASKGVHADIALEEAELCAINTFVVAGEVLRHHEMMTKTVSSES